MSVNAANQLLNLASAAALATAGEAVTWWDGVAGTVQINRNGSGFELPGAGKLDLKPGDSTVFIPASGRTPQSGMVFLDAHGERFTLGRIEKVFPQGWICAAGRSQAL